MTPVPVPPIESTAALARLIVAAAEFKRTGELPAWAKEAGR